MTSGWADPRQFAASLKDETHLAFFYSGMQPGRYSLLAWGLEEKVDSFEKLQSALSSDKPKYENAWFGYLGYGLRRLFENYSTDAASHITLPDLLMMRFKNIMVFDHVTKTITPSSLPAAGLIRGSFEGCWGAKIKSNMTDAEYLAKAKIVIDKIRNGEIYQANLTRKFFGEFDNTPDSFALFHKLTEVSPAPYSAYLKFGEHVIISASPEKFLTVENGKATTIPIKGTLTSKLPASQLEDSEKNRAENLMIVDLMRNDLARACGNVKVEKLFEVTSYAKYHHMSSTITGDVKTNALDVVKSCFPPGSMTGAPKIAAVWLCSELEQQERGVYSGAIGYFGGDGSCDLSVVIRTLIIEGNKFEFQVGGGIVADSTPENELEEIYVKASGIMEVLGS